MAYQVLARKWRPRVFAEMVGQAHVVRVLTNALDTGRLHHAYLFTGTRGVGKTTIARIFSKSLNCEQGVTSQPCGECNACREIDAGRFVDLLEVDAASRTKVDDTRELLDNVQYAPARGRFKVYLIDEVHMLSLSSFNALLKTLEEPPPHVKFLLATTDPQKLPATILSRCLQFNLKHLPVEQISAHLNKIVQAEQLEYESPAFNALARAAQGSMRDALSLLDQAVMFGGGKLTKNDTAAMLGALDQDAVVDLLEALAAQDGPALLGRVAQMAEHNPDYAGVLGDMLSLLQTIALAQMIPDTLDKTAEYYESVVRLCNRFSPEDVQLFYQIGLHGRRDLPLSPDARGGFEMVLLRMLAFRPQETGQQETGVKTPQPAPAPAPKPEEQRKMQAGAATAQTAPNPVNLPEGNEWTKLLGQLRLNGPLRMLTDNCVLKRMEQDAVYLALPPQHASVYNKDRENRLHQMLEKHFGRKIKLHISIEELNQDNDATPAALHQQHIQNRQQAAEEAIYSDPVVHELQQNFDAKVDKNSIKPL